MKFTLLTAKGFGYTQDERGKLKKVGFKFIEKCKGTPFHAFLIKGSPEIEINTIDELVEFINQYGTIIVDNGSITIYDGYTE
jgi:hypothetical protein